MTTTPLNEAITKPIPAGLRLGTMLLDHALICLIGIPPIILMQYLVHPGDPPIPNSPYVMMPLFVIYFCKDCIGGRSVAKRIFKLSVVDNNSGAAATPLQCLIRNLFVIIWPVEVFVALFNQRQRIGDRLAGTRLRFYDSNTSGQIRILPIIVSILLATLFTYLLLGLFYGF